MRKISILISIFISLNASSQIKAVTENGDTLLIYENGTWTEINIEKVVNNIISTVNATVTVDEFKNTKRITTEGWINFAKNNLGNTISGKLIDVDGLTVFSITYTGDIGCLSEYDGKMEVKLTNGDFIILSQITETDCGDYPSASYIPITKEQYNDPNYKSILKDNLILLKSYDFEIIRIYGSKFYTDLKPNATKKIIKPEQFFRQHIIAAEQK